jgi:glutamate dehydrogenase/leucine dehydrogenase
VQKIKDVVGSHQDIPAPDMNTDSRHMAWFFDEYSKFEGFSPGVVTGKPVWLHGSEGREAATGRGTVFGIMNLLDAYGEGAEGDRLRGKRFAIQARPPRPARIADFCTASAGALTLHETQANCRVPLLFSRLYLTVSHAEKLTGATCAQGCGNVGAWAARLIIERGGVVAALSDASGCVHDASPAGVNVDRLLRHIGSTGMLTTYPESEQIARDDIFEVNCDVLVPAAIGGVIDGAPLAHRHLRWHCMYQNLRTPVLACACF